MNSIRRQKSSFAFIVSTIPPLLWLLLVNRRAPRLLTHILPPVLLLLAGLVFFFLRPDVIPGGRPLSIATASGSATTRRSAGRNRSRARGGVPALSTKCISNIAIPRDIAKPTILKTPIPVKPTVSLAFFTLTTEEDWYPDAYPNILEAPCQAIKDPQAMTEYTRDHARWFPIMF